MIDRSHRLQLFQSPIDHYRMSIAHGQGQGQGAAYRAQSKTNLLPVVLLNSLVMNGDRVKTDRPTEKQGNRQIVRSDPT